jgi:hypothetical protein
LALYGGRVGLNGVRVTADSSAALRNDNKTT